MSSINLNLKSNNKQYGSFGNQKRRYTKLLNNVILEKQRAGELRRTMFYFKNAEKNRFVDINCTPTQLAFQMDKIISVLNRKLGNKWEVHLEPVFEDIMEEDTAIAYVFKGFKIYIMLHYPLINITNNDDDSHNIKDLIVVFQIKSNHYNTSQLSVTKPLGCRATLDYEEWFSSYQHSHLKKFQQELYKDCFRTIEFCIGGGTELSELLVDMWEEEYEFSDIIFESYLYALDSLVEWESIEGTPWHYIENITIGSQEVTLIKNYDKNSLKGSFEKITNRFMEDSLDNIDFVFSEGRYIIKTNERFYTFLKEFIAADSHLSKYLLYTERGDRWYGYVQPTITSEESLRTQFNDVSSQQPSIFIQGNELQFKVLPYNKEVESITGYKIHPNFIEYAKQQLEQKLFLNSIRKSTIEKYHQSINA